jgi:hypothetical protein
MGVRGDLKLSLQSLNGSFFGLDQALDSGDLATLYVDLEVVRESHDSQFQSGRSLDLLGDYASR